MLSIVIPFFVAALSTGTVAEEPIDYSYLYVKEPEIVWEMKYVSNEVNIREYPDIDADIIDTVNFNDMVEVADYEDSSKWDYVKVDDDIYYIYNEYLMDEKVPYTEYTIPHYPGKKTWMPYTAITSKSSPQYKLQQKAYTGKYGIRMVDDRYCVAIGTRFGIPIGTKFDLVLENGTVIPCILGDVKASKHTDSTNTFTVVNGSYCMSEFIIDRNVIDPKAKRSGNMSSVSPEWDSEVQFVRIY